MGLGAEDVPVDEPRLCSLLDSIDPGLKAPRQTFSVHIVQTHEQNGVNGPDRSSMNRFGLTASLIVFFYYERNEAESFFFLLFFLLLCSDEDERLREGEVANPQTPFF